MSIYEKIILFAISLLALVPNTFLAPVLSISVNSILIILLALLMLPYLRKISFFYDPIPFYIFIACSILNNTTYGIVCILIYYFIIYSSNYRVYFLIRSISLIFISYCVISSLFYLYDNIFIDNICDGYQLEDMGLFRIQDISKIQDYKYKCLPHYLYDIQPGRDQLNIIGLDRFNGYASEATIFSSIAVYVILFNVSSNLILYATLLLSSSYYVLACYIFYLSTKYINLLIKYKPLLFIVILIFIHLIFIFGGRIFENIDLIISTGRYVAAFTLITMLSFLFKLKFGVRLSTIVIVVMLQSVSSFWISFFSIIYLSLSARYDAGDFIE